MKVLNKLADALRSAMGSKGQQAVMLGAAALAAGGSAMAAVDTTAATAAFTDTGTAINAVGPVMLTAVAAGIVYKWVTAFLI